jgi:hypothetical protein
MNYSLRDDPRLYALTHYLHIFKPIFHPDDLTASDIEFAIQNPELDPLVGEVVTKLLARKINIESGLNGNLKYDSWCD